MYDATRMLISKPPKQKPSSQVSGFKSSTSLLFHPSPFLQHKGLVEIGMEKIVPNRNSRRNSTGNLVIDYTGVVSRYLKPTFPSCHDNCKPHPRTPTKSKSASPPATRIHKLLTHIPKPSPKDVKISNTSLLKHQIKPGPIEPKTHSKINSKPPHHLTDPFYIPPSTSTSTTRVTRRRYSDIITPTTGLGDVLDSPVIGALTRTTSSKKIEPTKDSKPANSVKTPGNGNISRKVQTLKAQYSSTKPGVDQGPRKSKPAKPAGGEVVQEKTSYDKTQTPTSDSSSRNEERVTGNDHISSSSKKDKTLQSDSQNNGVAASEVKKTEKPTRVRKLAMENGDCSPRKLKFNQGRMIDAQSESSTPRKLKFKQGKVVDENQNGRNDNRISLRRLPSDGVIHSPESHSVNVVLKPCVVEADDKRHSGLNNVIEETASKLIRTRKSKVKALVGAFEMISANDL